MRIIALFLSVVLSSALVSINAYAKERDPCDKNQDLKGWAKRAGYTSDLCSAGEASTSFNGAPSIAITAPTNSTNIEEGTEIILSGVASDDEDGDLSANISWSSSLDGSLATVTSLSVGTHTLTASISDSGGLTATDQTSLTVTAAPPGAVSVTVSWSIPSSRENGEALGLYEISGYEILYKKVGDSLYYSEKLTDALMTEYVVADLNPGDYEFKISAFDNEGLYHL